MILNRLRSRIRSKTGIAATAMATAAIAAGVGFAVVGPEGPAVAFFSPPLLLQIHVESGTVIAKGAAVDVTFQVECAGARQAFVNVNLVERFSKEIANSYGSTRVVCTDSPQTVVVQVVAQAVPFKPGITLAQSDIFGCARRFCADQTDSEIIKLVKK